MAKSLSHNTDVIVLRNSAAADTSTGGSSAEVANARMKGLQGGVAIIQIMAITDATDEEYLFKIQGRTPSGTGSYTDLATVQFGKLETTVAGVYLLDIDQLQDGMRVTTTNSGTSKSITYNVLVVAHSEAVQYLPSPAVALT